jgi:glutaminase
MLSALTQAQLGAWVAEVRSRTAYGRLPDYIPQLAEVDSALLAVQVQTLDGRIWRSGKDDPRFVLMSVIKPLLLLFALEHHGVEKVFRRVGMRPSDQSFHSLQQLRQDQGIPRNPMINSGAIALTALLIGSTAERRCDHFCDWLNQQAHTQLTLDRAMLDSVQALTNQTNRAIARTLFQAGYLDQAELAIDTYNHICCLSATVGDLANLGLLLLRSNHTAIVTALMLTCGLYEASGEFAVRIGIPSKSGVSGAVLAVVPRQGAIACYSPPIDAIGNSVAGLLLLETLSQQLNLSLFG